MTDRTNGPFRVGDVCVIVAKATDITKPSPDGYGRDPVGMECTIRSELRVIKPLNCDAECAAHLVEIHGYKSWHSDGTWNIEPHRLRLKRPPSKDDAEPRADFTPGEWDLIPWKPAKVRA